MTGVMSEPMPYCSGVQACLWSPSLEECTSSQINTWPVLDRNLTSLPTAPSVHSGTIHSAPKNEPTFRSRHKIDSLKSPFLGAFAALPLLLGSRNPCAAAPGGESINCNLRCFRVHSQNRKNRYDNVITEAPLGSRHNWRRGRPFCVRIRKLHLIPLSLTS